MAQLNGGIGNVTPNAGLVEMAMAYSRSRMLCAAAAGCTRLNSMNEPLPNGADELPRFEVIASPY
jgi:hypothetical protein